MYFNAFNFYGTLIYLFIYNFWISQQIQLIPPTNQNTIFFFSN